ncbi:MAG: dual specificity protein phosphatase family protein, partial [Hymenobacteraceae bacterium]|nr:dual specificity protein phosphatase family protein [Hymenobacteraceae bacterium]
MNLPPRPHANAYWATPQLLATEYPGDLHPAVAAAKLDALLGAGIREFIDLTRPHELVPYEELLYERATVAGLPAGAVRYQRLPIQDMAVPAPECLEEILAVLYAAETAGRPAVVHCWGGIGRTGTVVGAYLVRHGGAPNGEAALARIAREWAT